uniref:IS1096 element passenger TnpR family protein n=1 Tax=Calothrix rhizosoleniae TaxID=888997 RepID=UPI001178824E
NLKRPQQKSYPYIHGLYFVLRTSGLSQIITKGKKAKLVLDEQLLKIWQGLNPTEQYFTLLESWLIWGESEVLGNYRDSFNQLYRCLLFWMERPNKGLTLNSYSEQDKLAYYPGIHNLALLHLFGFIELTPGEPEPSKGWRINVIKRCNLGDAMIAFLGKFYTENESKSEEEETSIDFRIAFEKLQPHLQPYFPEWQQSLTLNKGGFTEAIYIFKVSLLDAWRRIAIPSNLNFDEVAVAVVDAFDFDIQHLYRFIYKDRLGRYFELSHPFVDIPPNTGDFRLGDLPLEVGNHLQFIFDLLDEWEFDLHLEKIESVNEKIKQLQILNSHGKPPSQYGDDEDEWVIINL